MNIKYNLTESEKNRILGLHKKAIIKENKTFLNEADLNQIQQLLIDKKLMSPTLASGKTSVDGRLGPVTLNAIYSALTQTQGTPAQGTPAQGTPAQGTQPATSNTPVKYPWIGADGRSSLASLQKAKTADPNFNNWLGELKKLSPPQLIKVKLDLSKFKAQISKSGIDVNSDQSYLVAYQAIADAQKFVGEQPTI